jgi:hypothetical protein
MGAARARIIRQFLTESLLLAAAGALGGFAIAAWATRILIAMLSSIGNPIALDLTPDWRVLLFTTTANHGDRIRIWVRIRGARNSDGARRGTEGTGPDTGNEPCGG